MRGRPPCRDDPGRQVVAAKVGGNDDEQGGSTDPSDRMLDLIEAKPRLLAANPALGPARPDTAPELRLFPIRRYVILYRMLPDGIEVVRVVHGMRDLPALP